MKKKKLFSIIASFAMILSMMLMSVNVSAATGTVVIDGDAIIGTKNYGEGTVTFDQITHTLILNNVTINATKGTGGIVIKDDIPHITIVLEGKNTINAQKEYHYSGIHKTKGDITIKGAGKLTINTGGQGITGNQQNNITIKDNADIFINSTGHGGIISDYGVITIENAIVKTRGTNYGILSNGHEDKSLNQAERGNVRIINSSIDSEISGISPLGEEPNNPIQANGVLNIEDSTVKTEGKFPIYGANGITINNSEVDATSSDSNGIYSHGSINIAKHSKLEVEGSYPALYSDDNIVIDTSEVKAISTNDTGIYSDGSFIAVNSAITTEGIFDGIYAYEGISINECEVSATSSKGVGLLSSDFLTIQGSTIEAKSMEDVGIYCVKDFGVKGNTTVKSSGYGAGIQTKGNLTIEDGDISASSSNAVGIDVSKNKKIVINGGVVHAKGGTGKPAIEVNGNGADRIEIIENWGEITYGKVASVKIGENEYITSMIEKEVEELKADRSNAMNEVTIKVMPADYKVVEEAKKKVPVDLSQYTGETVNALNEAIAAVVTGKDAREQGVVDAMAKAIEEAISNLTYKSADYRVVEEALKKVPTDLSQYSDTSVEALNKAINSISRDKNITEQEQVDAMAKAIEKAITNLKKKPVIEETKLTKEDVNTGDTTNKTVLIGMMGITMLVGKTIVTCKRKDKQSSADNI